MRKWIMALMALICVSAMATEGVHFTRSGVRDMLIRVSGQERYLLIPIEEAAPEYRMQVIEDGRIVRTVVLRLAAKGKIDYYVPMDLSAFNRESLVLAVHVWNQPDGERQREVSPMEYIAWNELKLANTFDTSNWDKYRPIYHHTPLYGWMNDPNGMFYKDGVWHLYYQYNPYCSMWQNMTWAHSSSKDLIHWTHEPIAIEPDVLGTIFSGSAVVDANNTAGFGKDAVIAMYTSAELMGQCQSLAYSTDNGLTFTKYSGNPIMTAPIPDFRDPNFFWNEQTNEWNLVLACGQEMRFYASADLKNWRYLSAFGSGYGSHSGVWECPDLMRLPVRGTKEHKWVLLCNINPGGPFGGSATQYFVGDWDGKTFTCEHNDTRWMDYGKDHYATVSFSNAPEERHTMIVWMSNWQYAGQVPTKQFRSANALPRDIDLFKDNDGRYIIGVRPSPECEQLRGEEVTALPEAAIIELTTISKKNPTTLTLSNSKGEKVVMTIDPKTNTFTTDRRHSGITDFSEAFAAVTTTPLYVNAKKYKVVIYLDRCSLEAFDSDGHWAMTNLVFPTEPYDQIETNGKVKIYNIKY